MLRTNYRKHLGSKTALFWQKIRKQNGPPKKACFLLKKKVYVFLKPLCVIVVKIIFITLKNIYFWRNGGGLKR